MEGYIIFVRPTPCGAHPFRKLERPRRHSEIFEGNTQCRSDLETLELVASSKFYFTRVFVNKQELYNILSNMICSISNQPWIYPTI